VRSFLSIWAALLSLLVLAGASLAQDTIYASPRATSSPAPDYPESAKAAGVQGEVVVRLHIDGIGTVTDATVVSGPEPLREAALRVARTWKFEPTMIGGRATPVVSTVNLTFGTTVGTAVPSPLPPRPPVVTSLPTPAAARGVVATVDGDKVIGSLKWEIKEEMTGKTIASGDAPVYLKDVAIDEAQNPTRRQTPKRIQLTNEFTLDMAEFPSASLAEKTGFGLAARHENMRSFSFEWFNVMDSKRAVKLQEAGELGIDLKQVGTGWEVTRTEFTTDVSLRILRMGVDPAGGPPYWRVNILKGSNITWPSLVNRTVVPN
jgi:TonB family protein